MKPTQMFPSRQPSLVAFSAEISLGTRQGKNSRVIEWTRRLFRSKRLQPSTPAP